LPFSLSPFLPLSRFIHFLFTREKMPFSLWGTLSLFPPPFLPPSPPPSISIHELMKEGPFTHPHHQSQRNRSKKASYFVRISPLIILYTPPGFCIYMLASRPKKQKYSPSPTCSS